MAERDHESTVRFGETSKNPLRRLRASILLSSFDGRQSDTYRAVHFLRDNNFFFADYSREFFIRAHNLLLERKIVSIRRLLVFESKDEVLSEPSMRLIQFHSTTEGYEYRLIDNSSYAKLSQDFDIHRRTEVGIFGRRRVFRARTDRPDVVIGSWSSKNTEISKYIAFFDACWGSSASHQYSGSINSEAFTLDRLFLSGA